MKVMVNIKEKVTAPESAIILYMALAMSSGVAPEAATAPISSCVASSLEMCGLAARASYKSNMVE